MTQLRLHATHRHGDTVITSRYCRYPYSLGPAFREQGDPPGMQNLIVQSRSGGMYPGEDLQASIQIDRAARLHLRAQSATVVQGRDGVGIANDCWVHIEGDGWLEYRPGLLVLLPEARLRQRLTVTMDAGGVFILVDGFFPHDPGANHEPFGLLDSEWRLLNVAGVLLAREHHYLLGERWYAGWPGVSGGYRGYGGLTVLCPGLAGAEQERLAANLRHRVSHWADIYAGVGLLANGSGIALRLLARHGHSLETVLQQAWQDVRQQLTGHCPRPRWHQSGTSSW